MKGKVERYAREAMADNVHYVNQPIEQNQTLSLKSPDAGKPRNIVARRKNGKSVVLQVVRGSSLLRDAKVGGARC
jgi:hypothetical protein